MLRYWPPLVLLAHNHSRVSTTLYFIVFLRASLLKYPSLPSHTSLTIMSYTCVCDLIRKEVTSFFFYKLQFLQKLEVYCVPYVCTLPNIVLLYVDVCKKLYLPITAVFKNNITGFIVLSQNLVPYRIKYSNLGKLNVRSKNYGYF